MLITFPLDHVVLSLAEESVLWTEEGAELKQLAAQFFESLRCMFQLRRNRSRMQQRPNSRAAQFLRPKVMEMVERKLNRHTCNLFEGVVAAFVTNAEPKIGAWRKRLYNFLRETKIDRIAIALTATHNFANSSPCCA